MIPTSDGRRPWTGRALQLLATSALLLLVFGIPIWLAVAAGRPELHVDLGALRQAVSHRGPGGVRQIGALLGQVAVILAWMCWVWLTICIALEVLAWRSGRSTVSLPASRSVQYAVALMVGTAFAVGTLGHLSPHDGGGGGTPTEVHMGRAPVDPPSRSESPVAADGEPRRSGSPSPALTGDERPAPAPSRGLGADGVGGGSPPVVHTVRHRETLWSIAEDRLGSPHRWRELAVLNYGVRQLDGSCLTTDHWVAPDWRLILPATHRPIEEGRPVDGGSARPGAITMHPDPPVPAVPLGAGIVGLGVADLVDRLRRVQQRHRSSGGRIHLPDPTLRPFEQRVRVGDGVKDLDMIEAALRMLADTPEAWPTGVRLAGARIDEHRVSLVFDSPFPSAPGSPFSLERDGRTVHLDREAAAPPDGRQRDPRGRFASPTLVSIGRTDGVLAMVDLEGHGSVVIEGDAVVTDGVIRAIALELATSRWASAFGLVVVGFDETLAPTGRVAWTPEAGPVIADLSWRRLTTSVRLDDAALPSVDTARRLGVVGDWRPVVVVCAPGVPNDDIVTLVGLAGDGRHGISVVAVPTSEDTRVTNARLRLGSSVEVLGTSVIPQSVDAEEFEQTGALLRAARVVDAEEAGDADDIDAEEAGPDPAGDPGSECGRDGPEAGERRSVPGASRVSSYEAPRVGAISAIGRTDEPAVRTGGRHPAVREDRAEVEIAVLGPVVVRGADRPFTRAWALELVVYLAMHPGGASNELWATALWPERLMAPSSLHSTASVARRSLGKAADGSDHLPRSHGRLALADTVATDWDRFQALSATDDPEQWEEALTLVRGRPFEGIRAADWTLLDGTAPTIESAVVDVSGRLAGFRLRSGDPHRAEWAARKGLLVSPYDERLYRMLLRTADAAGNPGGVEAVMAELVRVVADDVEPIESVHPSTLALYRSLSRRNHQALRSVGTGSR